LSRISSTSERSPVTTTGLDTPQSSRSCRTGEPGLLPLPLCLRLADHEVGTVAPYQLLTTGLLSFFLLSGVAVRFRPGEALSIAFARSPGLLAQLRPGLKFGQRVLTPEEKGQRADAVVRHFSLPHQLFSSARVRYCVSFRFLSNYCLNPRISINQTVSAPAVRSRSARPLGSDTDPRSSRSTDARYGQSCPLSSAGDGESS
jgi:hypothetical protein